MSLMRTTEELSGALVMRQRLIERARRALREDDLQGAVVDVLGVLEHVQANDEKLMCLHAECHGLIEYARKVLEGELIRRPFGARAEVGAPVAGEDTNP